MGIFEKANLIELNQEDLQDAKTTASLFKDEFVKRRAFANVIAARSALKLLFSLNIEATNLYSMYSINKVLERLDIADVYAGSIRIDARLVEKPEEIFIPKSHFELGITPDLYLILKLNKDMSGVEFLGCINPDEMDKSRENKDYYFVDEDLLYNLKIFKNLVKNNQGKLDYVPTQEDIERAENLIVPLEDGDIFNADYEFLMKQLAFNPELRKKTVEFENFEFVSQKVVTEETVYGDSVLGLVGSEKLYDRNEFSTDIDLEDLSESTVDDFVENFDEASVQIPEMNEFTGEVSLDDALSQMDDNFELNQEDENPEIIEMESSDDEHFQEKGIENEDTENLDNLINDVSEITDYSETEPIVKTDEPLHTLDDSTESLMSLDMDEADVDEPLMPISNDENLEPMIIDEDDEDEELSEFSENSSDSFNENVMSFDDESEDDENEFSNNQEEQGVIESLPELDIDEQDEDDLDFSAVDEDTPIDFDEGGDIDFGDESLSDIGDFSIDDSVDDEETSEIEESLKEEDEVEDDEASELPLMESDEIQNQAPHEEEIVPFDDDTSMADLPTLKILEEDPETYNKKIYKSPVIDDVDLTSVNLDDFDDYEKEDEEEEANKAKELDEMMSDLDNILNSGNISLDGVEDILTDEELNESLKQIEREEHEKEMMKSSESEDDYQGMESSENSQDVDGEETEQNESMSLDDFLNSSFNDMSTNPENNVNMDSNQSLDSIYQQEERRDMNNPLEDDPDTLLTNEATMVDNSANLYNDETDTLSSVEKEKPKSRAPQLMVVLVIMMCACLYVNKDIIMDNLNIQFPSKPEEPAAPEFDLNSLKEPTPAETPQDSPIPSIPQPTDTPDAPPAEAPAGQNPTAQAPAVPQAGTVPQNSSNKITKLSWEVPENMANNQKIRKYLQIAGRTLKLSLQNDLLVATELPFSNRVMIDLRIAPSGNLISSDFVISSGSKQIDNIVLQSVKDTLKYVRPPMGEIQSPNSNFTLIINF